MGRLAGKVVLVAGGARGLGRAAALACAAEGARVVIGDVDAAGGAETARIAEASSGAALYVPADITREEQVARLVGRTVEAFGRIDCALNAATERSGALKRLAETEEAEYERCLDTALKGVWLCMKHEILQLLAQEPAGGRIVNVSSVNGLGGTPRNALYAAAKAGVLALTKSGALDYADRDVQINALVPGMFEGPSRERTFESLGLDEAARRRVEEHQLSLVPAGRLGRPEEAAEMVVWLFTNAPGYLNGAALVVDGGLTAAWR